MKNKVIVLTVLITMVVSAAFLIERHRAQEVEDIPVNEFIGEKSDIEAVEQAVLTYIAESIHAKAGNAKAREGKIVSALEDYFIGVKITGNKATAMLGSDVSPYATRIYKLRNTNGQWSVKEFLYLNDLPCREKSKIFAKVSDISDKLVELDPEQVAYRFLSDKLHIKNFGIASIEERSDTECRCKVPLKDGRVVELVLVRPEKTDFSVRPWQVKSYQFTGR